MHVGLYDGYAGMIDFAGTNVTALVHKQLAEDLSPGVVRALAGLGVLDLPHRLDQDDYDLDPDRMLAAAAQLAGRFGRPAGIVSLFEHTGVPAARIRERLGVPGTDLATAVRCRDKVAMKAALRSSAVRTPEFAELPANAGPAELAAAAALFPGPLVLKPRSQAGAMGVRVFPGAAEFLQHAAAAPFGPGWQIEEFIDGPICHFDGVVRGGELRIFLPSEYLGNCYDMAANRLAVGSVTMADTARIRAAREFTDRVLRTIGLRDSAFHLEAFLGPGDEFVFLEIGNRVGGASVPRVFREVCGVDIMREAMLACTLSESDTTFDPLTDPGNAAGWLMTGLPETAPCRVRRIHGLDGLPPTVVHAEIPRIGQPMNDPLDLWKSSGKFVVRAGDAASVRRSLEQIIERYSLDVVTHGSGTGNF